MIEKIDIYLRRRKTIIGQYTSEPISDGVMKHDCLSKGVMKYELTVPEADSEVLRIVEDFANNKGLRVEVHDLSNLRERLTAVRKGINKTPAVVIGGTRIDEECTPELLESKLKAYSAK